MAILEVPRLKLRDLLWRCAMAPVDCLVYMQQEQILGAGRMMSDVTSAPKPEPAAERNLRWVEGDAGQAMQR